MFNLIVIIGVILLFWRDKGFWILNFQICIATVVIWAGLHMLGLIP